MKKIKFELLFLILFVLSRLPSLGHDTFTTDTWKWKSRSYDFGSGVFTGDFAKTLQKYHPGVMLMWIGTAGIKIYNAYYNLAFHSDPPDNKISTVFELDFVQKIITVLVIGITLAYVFYALRNIFGLKLAFISLVLVCAEPYYVGLSRVFHLEGLLSAFMLASATWLYWFLENGGKKKLIISAVFAGLSMLTKTTALYLIPFSLMMMAVKNLTEPGVFAQAAGSIFKKLKLMLLIKNTVVTFLIWALTASVVIFSLWPALWVAPGEVYKALYKGVAVVGIEREHIQYYFGKLVEDPGPAFYLVVLFFKSSPWLIMGIIGWLFIYKKLSTDQKKLTMYLFVYSIIYLLALSIPTKKLDRYFAPSLVSLAVVSSVFYYWLWEKIKVNNIIKIGISGLVFLGANVFVHPDYISFYNPLAGGLSKGINVLEPKWLIGERQILEYFKKAQIQDNYQKTYEGSIESLIDTKKASGVLIVALPEKYYTQVWPFFREIGAWAVISDLTAQANYAKYFVYPVWEDDSVKETRYKIKYDGSVYLRNVEVFRVYKRT